MAIQYTITNRYSRYSATRGLVAFAGYPEIMPSYAGGPMIASVNNILQWAGYSEVHMLIAIICITIIATVDYIKGVIRG